MSRALHEEARQVAPGGSPPGNAPARQQGKPAAATARAGAAGGIDPRPPRQRARPSGFGLWEGLFAILLTGVSVGVTLKLDADARASRRAVETATMLNTLKQVVESTYGEAAVNAGIPVDIAVIARSGLVGAASASTDTSASTTPTLVTPYGGAVTTTTATPALLIGMAKVPQAACLALVSTALADSDVTGITVNDNTSDQGGAAASANAPAQGHFVTGHTISLQLAQLNTLCTPVGSGVDLMDVSVEYWDSAHVVVTTGLNAAPALTATAPNGTPQITQFIGQNLSNNDLAINTLPGANATTTITPAPPNEVTYTAQNLALSAYTNGNNSGATASATLQGNVTLSMPPGQTIDQITPSQLGAVNGTDGNGYMITITATDPATGQTVYSATVPSGGGIIVSQDIAAGTYNSLNFHYAITLSAADNSTQQSSVTVNSLGLVLDSLSGGTIH